MDPLVVGLALLLLVVLLAAGVDIGVSLGLVGIVGVYLVIGRWDAAVSLPYVVAFSTMTTHGFVVIPMFILLGQIAAKTGIGSDLFDSAYRWFGRLPGGLAVSTIVTCAGMAAVTGSTVATASAMTQIALPQLRRFRYRDSMSLGVIAVGGTLAIMIPPSITLVLYSIFAGQSVGKLLVAGIIPGVMLTALYSIVIVARCVANPSLAPPGPRFTIGERVRSLARVGPFLLLVSLIIAGILAGVWTPVEASAAGVVIILGIGIVQRRISRAALADSAIDAAITSASVMVLVIGAIIFSRFLSLSGVTSGITEFVVALQLPPFLFFLALIPVFLALGMFLEGTGMLAITVPLLIPVITADAIGWDPIWFGVVLVSLVEVAAVTPPVGLNLYAVKAAAPEVSISTIAWGALPFWLVNLLALLLLYAFPDIALILPRLMAGT